MVRGGRFRVYGLGLSGFRVKALPGGFHTGFSRFTSCFGIRAVCLHKCRAKGFSDSGFFCLQRSAGTGIKACCESYRLSYPLSPRRPLGFPISYLALGVSELQLLLEPSTKHTCSKSRNSHKGKLLCIGATALDRWQRYIQKAGT